MTDSSAQENGKVTGNPLSTLVHSEAADRLKAEGQDYLAAQAQRMLGGLGGKLGQATQKLTGMAEEGGGTAKLALDGGRKLAEGKGPVRSALELGAGRVKDKVKSAFGGLGKGGKGKSGGNKPTVIVESVDVGVPLRTAYDQWTQYQDFSTFAKGVKSANRADDTHSDWQAKVFWSSRSWKATTTTQVPDQRIQWTSEGAKGSTKGVVTFHSLGDNLTRVLLVVEYYPSGLFEKTGNIWRAQGRRLRLDLKNYVRFISLRGEAKDSWRGEIEDGEVVRSHEDAVADEEAEQEESEEGSEDTEEYEDEESEDADDEEYEDAYDDGDAEEEEGDEDEYEDEEDYGDSGEDGYEEGEPEDDDEDAAEYEEEYDEEPEPAGGGSRR
ncbi:SRPBCC family protein [Streptomyces sp. J2-1]|uniref:SRPBCC family protein n=1 Tax=Streptomyces corallincola TaxID=2851888 RepID=UPI001C38739D|nr:SRPBCC family protein [Streptomyces corallincola]MBV2355504.1 SRPBCC family protein [Streptomyces corallincola]